ncbi:hypothetical protein D0T84_14485 [Dysgonomonas sp. 521]|uniref:cellulase family glycosylhydrolase n=1 Tax=Dysgonomonas sp. 521 TaxID=2302932 RepID=UPI0013D619F5|nr:cellulase family glycosylhydrolase [Dysgonomonas sp. 521]NDV96110.1 hypothetical protein [Dysgonomonas sp. 521]
MKNIIKILCLLFSSVITHNIYSQKSSPWGVSAHPETEREWPKIDITMKRMNDAGIKWIRSDFKFSYIYKVDAPFSFARFDTLVNIAEKNNINILPVLEAYDNEIAYIKQKNLVPIYKHPEEWRKYVRETVKRYHNKLKYWEIWNEQDGGFWKPAPNASQYVSLLKIAYEEIKKINPDCKVIVGGLNSWNVNYLQAMYNEGAKGYFDIVAVHPYNEGPDMSPRIRNLRNEFMDIIQKNDTKDIPVWITEFGGSTYSNQLMDQQPDFMLDAICLALNKLNKRENEELKIAIATSPRTKNTLKETTRNWLPNTQITVIPFNQLSTLDVNKHPVLIGAEGLNIDEPMLIPLLEYVKRGGLLIAVNRAPFYTLHYQDEEGLWRQRPDMAKRTYASFRMNFEAYWTKKGVPGNTSKVRTSDVAREWGLPSVSNVYLDRFLDNKNMKENDKYYPIIQAYNGNDEIGEGMALYTYGDWKGGILISTIQLASGYTEEEQANLLQRNYLIYLSLGVEKLFWYDLHSDGQLKGEKEHNFGLLKYDWSPKKAFLAYKEMIGILGENPQYIKMINGKDSNIWALIFKNRETKEFILATWSIVNGGEINIQDKGEKSKVILDNNKTVQFIPITNKANITF